MTLKKQEIIGKGCKSIETPRGAWLFNEIFFSTGLFQDDLTDKLKKVIKEENSNKYTKDFEISNQRIQSIVSAYINAWQELGYIFGEIKTNPNCKNKFHPKSRFCKVKIPVFFFDYAKDHLDSSNKFTKEEKIFLTWLLEEELVRTKILTYKTPLLVDKIKLFLYDYFVNIKTSKGNKVISLKNILSSNKKEREKVELKEKFFGEIGEKMKKLSGYEDDLINYFVKNNRLDLI